MAACSTQVTSHAKKTKKNLQKYTYKTLCKASEYVRPNLPRPGHLLGSKKCAQEAHALGDPLSSGMLRSPVQPSVQNYS